MFVLGLARVDRRRNLSYLVVMAGSKEVVAGIYDRTRSEVATAGFGVGQAGFRVWWVVWAVIYFLSFDSAGGSVHTEESLFDS